MVKLICSRSRWVFIDMARVKMGIEGSHCSPIHLVGERNHFRLYPCADRITGDSIVVMVFFSVSVQAVEGSTFGIVPYGTPSSTGSVCGIVVAGGTAGAIGFGLGFRQLEYNGAFTVMGSAVQVLGFLSLLLSVEGQAMLLCGADDYTESRTKNRHQRAETYQTNTTQGHDDPKATTVHDR